LRGIFIESTGKRGSTFLYKFFTFVGAEKKGMKEVGADFSETELKNSNGPKTNTNWLPSASKI